MNPREESIKQSGECGFLDRPCFCQCLSECKRPSKWERLTRTVVPNPHLECNVAYSNVDGVGGFWEVDQLRWNCFFVDISHCFLLTFLNFFDWLNVGWIEKNRQVFRKNSLSLEKVECCTLPPPLYPPVSLKWTEFFSLTFLEKIWKKHLPL